MEKLHDFLKNSEIVWTSSSYLSGHYTYGPFGKGLKNKIEESLRRHFDREDFVEIETPSILSEEVVKCSGHLDNFTDPVIYTQNKRQLRLDKFIEENFKETSFGELTDTEIRQLLESYNQKQTQNEDKVVIPDKWEYKRLMFATNNQSYLRPETATSTYLAFNDLYNISSGKTLPIRVFQIGRAFRDEINARHCILRCKEFTQVEAQLIFQSDGFEELPFDWEEVKKTTVRVYLNKEYREVTIEEMFREGLIKSKVFCYIFYLIQSWIEPFFPQEKLRYIRHLDSEKAFYALESWDLEISLNGYGWYEVCGLHHRNNYDLTQQSQYGPMPCQPIPIILELAIGLDRLLYSLVDCHYHQNKSDEGKKIFSLPVPLSPTQIAILPLVKNKQQLTDIAQGLYQTLKRRFRTVYLDKQSVGKRYMAAGMRAIPFCLTVDFQSVEDDTVTVRERDTESQSRIQIKELVSYFNNKLTNY